MQRLDYLQAMGIETWELRQPQAIENLTFAPLSNWSKLEQQVANCTLCSLHQTRTQTVFGVGNRQAKLMLIGEAPGESEDQQGEPFVGRAGQLLNSILSAIHLKREDIFIANILKCRPPGNRDPEPQETSCCTPYLTQQIELLQPKLIVALGRIAAQFLLNTTISLTQLRPKQHIYQNIPLLVTFHPAYLLRTPTEKAKAWLDWQRIQQMMDEPN